MSHAELVQAAARWLRSQGCSVVLTELTAHTGSGECPDAIGWRGTCTLLVECKTSRADFTADRKKIFRREPSLGMGVYRYFLAPVGLIKPDELPERWGLIEIAEGRAKRVAGHNPRSWGIDEFKHEERSIAAETAMLLSALGRVRFEVGEPEFRRLTHVRVMRKTTAELDREKGG